MIIWLASYPRSGNTLLRVLLYHVFGVKTYSIYNDPFDIGADPKTSELVGHAAFDGPPDLDALRRAPETFFIKTHDLPGEAIAAEDKVIYLIRDGREACVSHFNYLKNFRGRGPTLQEIIEGKTPYGGWASHVRAWRPPLSPNCLLIRFEDLAKDPLSHAERLAAFAGIEPVSNRMPTFAELRAINPKFFRSGRHDSWKEVFTEEDHILFWLRSRDVMLENGYSSEIPAVLEGEQARLLSVIYARVDRVIMNEYEQRAKSIAETEERFRAIVQTKDATIQTKDAAIRSLRESTSATLADVRERLEHRNEEIRGLRAQIEQLRGELSNKRRELAGYAALKKLLDKWTGTSVFRAPLKRWRTYRKLMALSELLVTDALRFDPGETAPREQRSAEEAADPKETKE
ncbi:MAG: sulfotransferase domain-containing protein [Planctomycetota bacterium]